MIIAGYAGVGKTYFSENTENAIEIPSMPYSWILPKNTDKSAKELEKEKGAFYHLANPLFPMNYVFEILKAERSYKYVIIPTVEWVLEVLQEKYDRNCVLLYPEASLKEEYRQRYITRGNSDSFMSLFIDGWEERIKDLREYKGVHIPLAKGEYLSNVKLRIDNIIRERIKAPISARILNEIETELLERKQGLIMFLFGMDNEYAYRISNIDDYDAQKFLYDAGRLAYKLNVFKPSIMREDEIPTENIIWIESQEAFMDAIRQNSLDD
jgi:adenylate kinase family enzyme